MITAEIQSAEIDQNGNIRVKTYYKKDGVIIQEGHTRYSMGSLPTIEEIQTLILTDIKNHAENLIARSYVKQANVSEIEKVKTWLIGKKYEATTGKFITGNTEFTVNETDIISSKPVGG